MTDHEYTISPPSGKANAALAKAFVAAQKASETVKKANTNPAFKSKYADLAAVVEAVVPALNGAGVGVMQFPAYRRRHGRRDDDAPSRRRRVGHGNAAHAPVQVGPPGRRLCDHLRPPLLRCWP
jgi:hypothetical protein